METQSSWHRPIQVDAFIMYGHEYMGTLVAMVALVVQMRKLHMVPAKAVVHPAFGTLTSVM